MVKIENVANNYLEGKLEIVLPKDETRKEELEFSIDMDLNDLNEFAFLLAKSASGDLEEGKNALEEQQKILRRVLQKSYPSFDEKTIRSIIIQHGNELLLEIYLTTGLRDRKAWNALLEKRDSELKKFKENGSSTTPSS
jgi:hypothetical protein